MAKKKSSAAKKAARGRQGSEQVSFNTARVAFEAVQKGKATPQQVALVDRVQDAVSKDINDRIALGEWLERASPRVGRKAARTMLALLTMALPSLRKKQAAFAERHGLNHSREMQADLEGLLLGVMLHGYSLGASISADSRRDGSNKGGQATSAKAKAKAAELVAAWDATDPRLSDGKRYAIVMQKTGVKTEDTIRKALKSR